jgi:Uncharacterized conserved protein
MKNILIIPGTTDLNRGDQTLLWESIEVAKNIYSDSNIFLYESGVNDKEKYLQRRQTVKKGFVFLERILQHPRRYDINTKVGYSTSTMLRWGVISIWDMMRTSMLLSRIKVVRQFGYKLLSKIQKYTYDTIASLDLVIVKGGGFLHSYGKIRDAYLMYYFLFDIKLAQRLNKKVVILPNSIGPLKNTIARSIVKKVLKKCVFVSTRENVSQAFVSQKLKINNFVSPDLGFYQKASDDDFKDELVSLGVDFTRTRVALTLRPYRFDGTKNASELFEKYITEMTRLVSLLTDNGIQVSLVKHTLGPSAHEDDTIALNEVYEKLENKSSVIIVGNENWDCQQLQKVYSYYDFLIGTRFHSVIYALNMKVPCIAIAYGGNKSYGIMKDIGVEQYVVPIENVSSEKIFELLEQLRASKEEYINKLEKYQAKLVNERKNLIYNIKQRI